LPQDFVPFDDPKTFLHGKRGVTRCDSDGGDDDGEGDGDDAVNGVGDDDSPGVGAASRQALGNGLQAVFPEPVPGAAERCDDTEAAEVLVEMPKLDVRAAGRVVSRLVAAVVSCRVVTCRISRVVSCRDLSHQSCRVVS
jgi:hypothetical protein